VNHRPSNVPVDLDHQRVVGAVGPRCERTADVSHVDPKHVVEVDGAQCSRVAEDVRQVVVDRRSADAGDRADQVDGQHRVPQRGVGFRCCGDEVVELHFVRRVAVVPLGFHLPARKAVGVNRPSSPLAAMVTRQLPTRGRPIDVAVAPHTDAIEEGGDLFEDVVVAGVGESNVAWLRPELREHLGSATIDLDDPAL